MWLLEMQVLGWLERVLQVLVWLERAQQVLLE
jgi:hypothetical protein